LCPDGGRLRKLGIRASATTIRTLLRVARLGPAPRRGGPTWAEFLRAQAEGIISCDFFTVETAWLRTLYILVFIELGSRRIHVSPSTAHPDAAWVTQQARNLALGLDARTSPVRFLIRDHDPKFSRSFDAVVRSEGARVIVTPIQAPNANAHAERVIEAMRAECLDWTLILGRRHLDRTLRTYAEHYNRQRPHRALALAAPLAELRSRSRSLSVRPTFAGGTCSVGSSTSTTGPPRDRIGVSDPHGRRDPLMVLLSEPVSDPDAPHVRKVTMAVLHPSGCALGLIGTSAAEPQRRS
jgi:hypothetical protein